MIVKDLQADYNALKDDTKHSYNVSVPSALSMYPSLSDADYRVLTVLMSFFNQYEETFASNKLLAESTNRSERSITRIVGNLKKQGYITVDFEYKGKEIIKRWIRPTSKLSEINQLSKSAIGIDKTGSRCIDKSGVENKNINNKNIEYRESVFRKETNQHLTLYPLTMINDFCDYWTEPNKSRTKMRFELERTFDVKRRLATWKKNSKKFGSDDNGVVKI